jgi:hypothetical protein
MSNKYQTWWDSLTPQMQTYLSAQPIWHDHDLYKATAIGFVVGVVIGLLF